MKRAKRKLGPPHGSEGRVELGERVIDDPLEPGQRYAARVNVRECSIDHMASRGRIDPAQAEAGQRFRRLWEKASVGRNQAMDLTREAVDGGGLGDPISDGLVKAGQELARVMRELGPVGAKLLISVVGEGKRIEDVASTWTSSGGVVSGKRAEGYVTGRMVEALDELVHLWKLESSSLVPNAATRGWYRNGTFVESIDDIQSSTDGHTGPARQLVVGRFGDIVEDGERPVDKGPLTPHVSGNIK
jgi:hypothetical protein